MKRPILTLLAAGAFGVTASGLHAALVQPLFNDYSGALGGNSSTYQWSGSTFTAENAPAGVQPSVSGNAGQWVFGNDTGATNHGIIANNGSIGNRFFVPTIGTSALTAVNPSDTTDFLGADAFGGGIYNSSSLTHFEITSIDPIASLKSLTLQLYFGEGIAPGFTSAPSLTVITATGTVSVGAANFSLTQASTSVTTFFPTHNDSMGFQWDLSGVTSQIISYAIDWQATMHSITYGANVSESDAVHNTSALTTVPEPSTYALLACGAGVVLLAMRRRAVRS